MKYRLVFYGTDNGMPVDYTSEVFDSLQEAQDAMSRTNHFAELAGLAYSSYVEPYEETVYGL